MFQTNLSGIIKAEKYNLSMNLYGNQLYV